MRSYWSDTDSLWETVGFANILNAKGKVPCGFKLYTGKIFGFSFQVLYFIWQRITDDGSLPDMCIWSILLLNSIRLKKCIRIRKVCVYFSIYMEYTATFKMQIKEQRIKA